MKKEERVSEFCLNEYFSVIYININPTLKERKRKTTKKERKRKRRKKEKEEEGKKGRTKGRKKGFSKVCLDKYFSAIKKKKNNKQQKKQKKASNVHSLFLPLPMQCFLIRIENSNSKRQFLLNNMVYKLVL